jgi:hypothetical protein
LGGLQGHRFTPYPKSGVIAQRENNKNLCKT